VRQTAAVATRRPMRRFARGIRRQGRG
jgi:hypothetical protein